MNIKKLTRNNSANIFMEYALMVGLIAVVLVTMNTYLKRGFQGKVKDVTDYFMSQGEEEQVDKVDPDTKTKNETVLDQDNVLKNEGFAGGRAHVDVNDTTTWDVSNLTISPEKSDPKAIFDAEDAQVDSPARPTS